MSFVHLHLHTHYSLLDGLGKPEDYIKKAKAQGSPAIAITDHGVMYGAVEFYQKCKEQDIKPIIGCEIYLCKEDLNEKTKANRYHHLILLAKNEEGYQNLMRICTVAAMEGFYYKPRIDYSTLEKYSKGLIATSACLGSEISHSILTNKEDLSEAKNIALNFQKIFGKDHFYLELQHHPQISNQQLVNEKLIEISKETKIPLVATNDCHYVEKTDRDAHDVLICIQTGKNVHDEHRMRYLGDYSMRSPEEMREAFQHVPEACENTLKIAEMCDLKIPLGQNLLPPFETPQNNSQEEYLKELCMEGIKERYGDPVPENALKRLEYELEIINEMGFASYFLIVHDFVNYAKKSGITVGPGRGSAAGAILSYCLKITDIDPLKYNLLFERFLNPERVSMPDIDIDFSDKRRDEVLEYVQKKYGQERVAQIITFGTMAARAAVRDSGRALGYSYSEVDEIAKAIPSRPGTKLKEALEEEAEMQIIYKKPHGQKVIDTALKLEGCVRHSSVHACAVVISSETLTNFTPLQKASGQEGVTVTQYSMKPIEKIGLLKMDFLGLKNLSIMETCINIIKETKNQIVDLEKIPLEDEKAFELLQKGQTTGVFQLESAGMKRYLKELKPTCFEDIIAMVSLYRPGPMDWIPTYIDGKHGRKKISYLHPSLEEVLKETYGIAVYQEQILQIAQKFGGFSLGQADLLRRAIGKKIAEELMAQRTKFIEGAVTQGHDQKLAIKIFDEVIEPFAGYGFNKSHAACYAMIAYQTAYLKAHHPAEFMAALMTADSDNTDRIIIEIGECKDLEIDILPPSVNESFVDFTVVENNKIRFGLSAIKGLGTNTVTEIIQVRKQGGKFRNLEDFAKRIPQKLLNKKTLEALALSGAMDEIEERKKIVENIPEISSFAKNIQKEQNDTQIDIFGEITAPASNFKLKEVEAADTLTKLKWEKEYLGLYVSAHPLQGLKKYLAGKAKPLENFKASDFGKPTKIAGMIESKKVIFTKSGGKMAYIGFEDPTGKIEVIVFPRIFEAFENQLVEGAIVLLEGKMEKRGPRLQYICSGMKKMGYERLVENAKTAGVYDPNEILIVKNIEIDEEKSEEAQNNEDNSYIIKVKASKDLNKLTTLKNLLTENKGDQSVEIHIVSGKKLQRIKVPFGVNLNENLKEKIKELTS